jgi:hypothetical protein
MATKTKGKVKCNRCHEELDTVIVRSAGDDKYEYDKDDGKYYITSNLPAQTEIVCQNCGAGVDAEFDGDVIVKSE